MRLLFTLLLLVAGCRLAIAQSTVAGRVVVPYQKIRNTEFTGWETAESSQTLVVDSLRGFKPHKVRQSRWGGRLDLGLGDTVIGRKGFFRLTRTAGRWYFVDPDGGLLLLTGVQSLGDCAKIEKPKRWARQTARLLRNNGFNNTNFGAPALCHFSEVMPTGIGERILSEGRSCRSYVELAFVLRSFVWKIGFDDKHFNRLMAVFHPKYLDYIDRYLAERTAKIRDDRSCAGYFIDNELGFLGWRKMFADQTVLLRNFLGITDAKNREPLPESYAWARQAALNFLQKRGVAPDAITDADDEAFRAYVADYYYRTMCQAIRRHDPNHLILGNRLHGFSKYDSLTVAACAKWCDAVSINYYGKWTPEADYLQNLDAWSRGKPFLVTEFYVKGEDAQHDGEAYENREGGGWLVRTQADRGRFYQNFTLHLLQAKNCVGWIHFKYRDAVYRSQQGGRAYCNKGIVDVECKPYDDFLRGMRQVNQNIYPLIDYFDAPTR